jgi:hypothetical protein
MSIHFESHYSVLEILPTLAIGITTCDHCDEPHGGFISFGWLFWQIAFAEDPDEHE